MNTSLTNAYSALCSSACTSASAADIWRAARGGTTLRSYSIPRDIRAERAALRPHPHERVDARIFGGARIGHVAAERGVEHLDERVVVLLAGPAQHPRNVVRVRAGGGRRAEEELAHERELVAAEPAAVGDDADGRAADVRLVRAHDGRQSVDQCRRQIIKRARNLRLGLLGGRGRRRGQGAQRARLEAGQRHAARGGAGHVVRRVLEQLAHVLRRVDLREHRVDLGARAQHVVGVRGEPQQLLARVARRAHCAEPVEHGGHAAAHRAQVRAQARQVLAPPQLRGRRPALAAGHVLGDAARERGGLGRAHVLGRLAGQRAPGGGGRAGGAPGRGGGGAGLRARLPRVGVELGYLVDARVERLEQRDVAVVLGPVVLAKRQRVRLEVRAERELRGGASRPGAAGTGGSPGPPPSRASRSATAASGSSEPGSDIWRRGRGGVGFTRWGAQRACGRPPRQETRSARAPRRAKRRARRAPPRQTQTPRRRRRRTRARSPRTAGTRPSRRRQTGGRTPGPRGRPRMCRRAAARPSCGGARPASRLRWAACAVCNLGIAPSGHETTATRPPWQMMRRAPPAWTAPAALFGAAGAASVGVFVLTTVLVLAISVFPGIYNVIPRRFGADVVVDTGEALLTFSRHGILAAPPLPLAPPVLHWNVGGTGVRGLRPPPGGLSFSARAGKARTAAHTTVLPSQ